MQTSITCSICNNNSGQIITDNESGEIICRNCGMVMLDNVQETRPEWRSFTTDEANNTRSRTGMPTSLARHDKGLATIIGRANKDASGQVLDAAMRTTMERLRTWDFRTQAHTSTDRNLRQAFSELDRLKDKLGLPDSVIEKTAYIYRKVQERGLVRGRTISSVLAAAAYIACREMGMSRTLDDIAHLNNIKHKELARTFRLLVLELDLKVPMIDPMKCVVKVANKAKLSEKTKRQAMNIMHDIVKSGVSAGKDPMGLAGSVIYMSSINTGETITQMDIADAAGVTEVTIRNRYKDIKKHTY
ncbi:MAG: transcription initiation factor Brf1 subunit/transcription initiation factor [Nitrososphaeraceae archaeon]|jgi:transcription initiation factor TFIIB|nr:transcription initiation factor Brf1 subunit/transcription initiation factor [Nitrososphaeraceae archaeon]